jgi:hypothetical protein
MVDLVHSWQVSVGDLTGIDDPITIDTRQAKDGKVMRGRHPLRILFLTPMANFEILKRGQPRVKVLVDVI